MALNQSQSGVFAWNIFSWSTVSFCWFGFHCCCWAASSCGFFTDLCLCVLSFICVLLFSITENVLQRWSRVSPIFNKIMKYQNFKPIAFWWCKCKKIRAIEKLESIKDAFEIWNRGYVPDLWLTVDRHLGICIPSNSGKYRLNGWAYPVKMYVKISNIIFHFLIEFSFYSTLCYS